VEGARFIGGGGCGVGREVRVRIEEFRDTKPKKQTSKRPACLQSHAAPDQETRICGHDSSALNRAARNFQLPSLALCHFCHRAVGPERSRVGALPFDVREHPQRRRPSAAKRVIQSVRSVALHSDSRDHDQFPLSWLLMLGIDS
jgi:hypothetical protein